MAAKERNLLMEIEAINRLDVEKYEAFIEANKRILHGNHAFILKVYLLKLVKEYYMATMPSFSRYIY